MVDAIKDSQLLELNETNTSIFFELVNKILNNRLKKERKSKASRTKCPEEGKIKQL